jgi:hypothetical protein
MSPTGMSMRPARSVERAFPAQPVEVGELDLGLAALVARRDGVLVLDLAVEDEVGSNL